MSIANYIAPKRNIGDNNLTRDLQSAYNQIEIVTNTLLETRTQIVNLQETLGGSIIASSDRWVPTNRWLDGAEINETNYSKYCDGILFRRKSTNQYEKVRLDDNRIDMSLYLVGDDFTDNYSRFLSFITYISQAVTLFTLTLVFTDKYYISDTINLYGMRLNFRGSGVIRFAPNKNGFFIRRVYNDKYSFDGTLTILGGGGDNATDNSLIDPRSDKFNDFLSSNSISKTVRRFQSSDTIQSIIDRTPVGGLIPSFNPEDYCAGIMCTGVMSIKNITVAGFGIGVFMNAFDITQPNYPYRDGSIIAPNGADSSMSIIENVTVKGNRGYGLAIFGKDANQIRIINCDARENGLWGFYDGSQAGCHWLFNHAAVNQWGGYAISSNGDPTVIGCYQEVDEFTSNIFASGTVLGGPLNSKHIGSAFILRKNRIDGAEILSLKTDNIVTRGTPDNAGAVLSLSNTPTNGYRVNYKATIGTKRGLFEIIDENEASSSGRQVQLPTVSIGADVTTPYNQSYKGVLIHDILEIMVDSFIIPEGIKFKKGDKLVLRSKYRSENIPCEWVCTNDGVFGNKNHINLGGPEVTVVNSQLLKYSFPTSLFQDEEILFVNGTQTTIGNSSYVEYNPSKATTGCSTSVLTNLTSPAIITFPKPTFKAIGSGSGYTNERPNLQSKGDIGWEYFDRTINKKINWNGDNWVDFSGQIV